MDESVTIKKKHRKSITINPSPSASSASSTPIKNNEVRKSILKNSQQLNDDDSEGILNENSSNDTIPIRQLERRPYTLEEYKQSGSLIVDDRRSSLTIGEIGVDDELWLFDIPKTLNPHELKGQTFYFGDKTKLKIGNQRYLATSVNNTSYFTCIIGTGREKSEKRFKAVNIQPTGTIVIRKKLSNIGNNITINDDDEELNSIVPFPDNLKIRHPLMNVGRKKRTLEEKKMKKSSSSLSSSSSSSPIKSKIKKHKHEYSE